MAWGHFYTNRDHPKPEKTYSRAGRLTPDFKGPRPETTNLVHKSIHFRPDSDMRTGP